MKLRLDSLFILSARFSCIEKNPAHKLVPVLEGHTLAILAPPPALQTPAATAGGHGENHREGRRDTCKGQRYSRGVCWEPGRLRGCPCLPSPTPGRQKKTPCHACTERHSQCVQHSCHLSSPTTGPAHGYRKQGRDPMARPEGGVVSTHFASFTCISLSFCCIWLFRSITNCANCGQEEHAHETRASGPRVKLRNSGLFHF